MKSPVFNHADNRKRIRIAPSANLVFSLLILASFIAVPTYILVSPVRSLAAPAPFPRKWFADIVRHMLNGTFGQSDVDTIKKQTTCDADSFRALIRRLNIASSSTPTSLEIQTEDTTWPGSESDTSQLTIRLVVYLNGKKIATYTLCVADVKPLGGPIRD
jgi:hypothetical protein